MVDGTTEDYELLLPYEERELAQVPDRILGWLRAMDEHTGYQVTRLGHSLQAATRALRAGEDEEMVVCALVHDVGDVLAPANHSEVVAAMVRPYVSERNYWILKHHGVFQGVYWFQHIGADPNARDRWADTPGTRRAPTSAPTMTRTPSTPTTRPSRWWSSSRWSDVCSTRGG